MTEKMRHYAAIDDPNFEITILNKTTGEMCPPIEIEAPVKQGRKNNIPDGKQLHMVKEFYSKSYERSWDYLLDHLTPVELKIVIKMGNMAEINTNSLAPLDDTTTLKSLADFFGVGKNHIKIALKNLFKIGVYASFKYSHYRRGPVEEWILNPYVSFKGKLAQSDIAKLFVNTDIAKLYQ